MIRALPSKVVRVKMTRTASVRPGKHIPDGKSPVDFSFSQFFFDGVKPVSSHIGFEGADDRDCEYHDRKSTKDDPDRVLRRLRLYV